MEQEHIDVNKQRLFVDMDGTLAVFTPVDELETLYQKGYFRNLAPHKNVVESVRHIINNHPEIEVRILSAYLTDSQYALQEKNEWLDEHLPEIDQAHRIFCPCGSDKKEWIPGGIREDDHLLDDYTKNLNDWEPPARGIKLLNAINHTRGSWQNDRIRYDRTPESLANGIVDIMQGKQRIFDDKVTSNTDIKIQNQVLSYYSGQMNAELAAVGPDGEVYGYIKYAEYREDPYIQYIEVAENHRRQGIATNLLRELQKLYEGKEIDWGMTTEDGTKLREAITYVVEDAEVKALTERLSSAQTALQHNEAQLNELYKIEEPSQEDHIEFERLGEQWEALTDEIWSLKEQIGDRRVEKRFIKMEEVSMEREETVEKKIKIPPISVDPAVVFFEEERPEDFALYEAQREAAEGAWREIILGADHSFAAAEFTTPGDYGQTLILTKSVRDGVDYQLSFFDKNGEATMHEDYYIDKSVEPIDIRGNSRESLFTRLANYSLRGREITATVNYEPKERENMAEKNIVQVQSAVRSNYDGYVALSQFDRNRPWDANDYRLYLGKRENYDNQGNYDNSDNSLVFISNNRKIDSFLNGEGWVQSQQAMIDNGTFTAADYAEYAQLKETVLKQFEAAQLREVKFDIDMDMREQGQESGAAFQYPNWDGQRMSFQEKLEAVYWRDRKSDGEGVVTDYHRVNGEIRLIEGKSAVDVERSYARITEEYSGDDIPRVTEQDRAFVADLAKYDVAYQGKESPMLSAYSELSDAVYPSVRDLYGDEFAQLRATASGLDAAEGAEAYRLVVLTSERYGERDAEHNIAYNQLMSFEDVQDYREDPSLFLEGVYARLGNAGMQPSNYYGHSPSVADAIVILTPEGGAECHYVASFGFQQENNPNLVITPEQRRAARLGMTVREEYDLLVKLNEAARGTGDVNLVNTVEEQTLERLDFLYDEYRPVFNLAAIREVMVQERDKLQILEAWEEANNVESPIAGYADGMYFVNNDAIRAALNGSPQLAVGTYNRDYTISAGERLLAEINNRFERAAREISEGYPHFYRLHASPRPLGDQGQYDFFVQRYERSNTEPGVIPRDIVYVGDSKTAIEVTNHLNAGSEYGEYLEENYALRRQLGLGALMGNINKWDVSNQSQELTELRDWRVDRVTRAMEAAGYSLDPIETTAERAIFNGEYGARMEFETVHAAEEWLDGVVFDDPEMSDAVEKIMHPERFALDGLTQQDMTQLIFEYETMYNIPATNDFIPEVNRMTVWDAEHSVAVSKPSYGENNAPVSEAVIEERCREILAAESKENIHLAYTAILEARQERMGLEIGGLAGRLQEQAAGDMNRQDSPWGSWFATISHPERPQDYIQLDITGYSTRNSVIESATLVLNGNVHEQLEMDEMSFDDYGNEEGFDTGFAGAVAELASRFDPSITENYVLYAPAGWSEHSLNEHYQMLRDNGFADMPNWDVYNARVRGEAAQENANERRGNVAEQDRIHVAIESTDDYTDTGFHQRLIDDHIQNEDGSYGKVVDYYRIVAIGENGRLAAFDDRVFESSAEARAAVAELPGLELVVYDDLVHEAEKVISQRAQEKSNEPELTVLFRDEANDIEAGINADGDLYLSGSRSGYNLPDTIENRRVIERDIERYTGQQVDLVGDMQEPELEEDNGNLTFYVAESMEFENLGEYHEGLTLQEAFDVYDSIPSERLNGGKGIGFNLQDGSIYSGNFALLLGNEVQDYMINEIDHFRNSPLVQQAVQNFKAEFDRRYGVEQVQQQQPSSFIAHYYVVEDLQVRGPLATQTFPDLNQALAAYAALPSDKMKALGIQNTNDLPGSLDIVQCRDGADTFTNDWEKIEGWNNPEVLNAVQQITEALEENAAIERRARDEEQMEEPLVDIHDLSYDDEGYLHFMVDADGYQLEGLYRVLDPANGEDMELVSIDYGDRHPIIERQWDRIADALYDESYDRYNAMIDQRFEHKDRLFQAMALAGYVYNEQASTTGHHVFDAGQGGIAFVNLDAAYRWFDGYMMLADHPLEAQIERILSPEQYESPIPAGDEWFYNDPVRGDVISVHYNPDSNAGGQFVQRYISYDMIQRAARESGGSEQSFFEYIDEHTRYTELIDVNTVEFKEAAAHYRTNAPDIIRADGNAMEKLVRTAEQGIEQQEVQKYLQGLVEQDVQNHGAVMPETMERIAGVGFQYNEETGIVEIAENQERMQESPFISIGNNVCAKIDEWIEGNNRYVLGNSVEDNTFYYAMVNNNPAYMFEYDEKPSRKTVEGDFVDREAERAIDEHEAEFGADGRRAFPNLNEDEVVYRLDDSQYLYIQESEEGYDYTIYDADMKELDGGQLDWPELTIAQARTEILTLHEMHPEKIERISIEEYERIGYEAERRNRPLTYSENEALVKLAERIDNFMYDYDTYNYHDDVGNTLEERSEHRAHLANALENMEYSPMIDTFRNIIAEEEAALTPNTEVISQANAILHNLTHLDEYQRNYAARQQETGEVRDPMVLLAARLDSFAYDANREEWSQSWNREVDELAESLRNGDIEAAAQWVNSAERYLSATNDENRNGALLREAHDLSYTLQHLDQYQQFFNPEREPNAVIPIEEFKRDGRTLEGDQIPGRNIPANTIGYSDRAAVFNAVQTFEDANNLPANQREIHNGTYEDKDFLYMGYDRHVGMSHRNDLSVQPYMERLNAMAEDKSKHISLLPLVAEVYYAQQNGLSHEQIDMILTDTEQRRMPLDSIRNLRHACENGLTQEQIAVLIGEDSFAQESLMGYMAAGGSIENAMALKGCDVAQYYILSNHLNEGSLAPDMAQAIIQAGKNMKDWTMADMEKQKAELGNNGPEYPKYRFSEMDFEFFTEYLADVAANDKSITPEMVKGAMDKFVEQRETDNLRKFIENSGGFQVFDPHREESRNQPEAEATEEEKEVQAGVALPSEKKDPKELLTEQLQKGVQNVLNSENFKNWLDTSSKMFLNNYSFNNAILVWLQKPDATHTMGYEQWKEYGRNVAKGAEGIKIFVPVIAYEKKDGDLWRMIKGKLQAQMKADPSLPLAAFRVGMSKLEITMNRNGLFGLRVDGKERGLKSEKDMQDFIKHSVIGKVPMYFTVGTVFDAKDTIIPEHLWMKKGFTKAEMVKDENGKPIKNRRGEYKIINTPERQAKFQPSLEMKVPEIEPEKAAILYDALKGVSQRNGIPVFEKARAEDDTLKGGADGYFAREFSDEHPKGYIVMPTDLEPTKAVSVLIHEISHSELHGDLTKLAQKMGEDKVPSNMREIQAEAVAYVVGKNFGIESDISSFNYLAAYTRGFELQALTKSIEVIYGECKQLTTELKAELASRGLNMDLSERDKVPMDKEAVESLAKTYIGYALEQSDRIADIEKELPGLVDQNKGKDTAIVVLVAQASNVNRQKEEVALIHDVVGALEVASTFGAQKECIVQIEAARNRIENLKKDFGDLSVQFQEIAKAEQTLKDRFVADPVATIKDMGANMDYVTLGALSNAQIQYLAKSEYVARELAPLLRNDPAQFEAKAYERASQIDKVASKNGMFVEVSFCEQWTDKPIVENGALMHPKVADTIVKQAEAQIRGLRAKAESVGDYFPYSKCAISIYQAQNGEIAKAYQTRVDIGDGSQSSLTDFLKQVSSAKTIVADFEKATREKGAKEKILFNDAQREAQIKENVEKEAPLSDRAMTRDDWTQEIGSVREAQKAAQDEKQTEKSGHKKSGQDLSKE